MTIVCKQLIDQDSYLDAVLDLASVVMYDESWLHYCRELNVAIPLVLPLKLIQQGLVSCLGEATETEKNLSMYYTNLSVF